MAEAGRRLAHVLDTIESRVVVGVTTKDLDAAAYDAISDAQATPAFLGYAPAGAARPYPATICASLNDGVVHGLPTTRPLVDGDVLKIDIGLVYKGWYADMARTYVLGTVDDRIRELVRVTRQALERGIGAAQSGSYTGDIGAAIQTHVLAHGFSIAEGLTGHGIGRHLHEDPYVPNTGTPGRGVLLQPGMVIAIEPMVAMGKAATRQRSDDSFVTRDGSIAAHFEHTVAITEHGPRILTT